MTKRFVFLIVFLSLFIAKQAQILPVKVVTQEQNQWCWAGVSQCILDYYSVEVEQCEIAEYARSVITWHNFGSVNCCEEPDGPCNWWNYNWGAPGSIQEILVHFGQLDNMGVGAALSHTQVVQQLGTDRLFVIRWGWTAGGGHFIVGHGIDGQTLYYMDPWFGEGAKFANYDWVVRSTSNGHTWTHTNVLNTMVIAASASGRGTLSPNGAVLVFPGEDQTFTITPDSGYQISRVRVNGVDNPDAVASGSYTFTNVTTRHTINATFTATPNNISTPTENTTEVKIYPNPSQGLVNVVVAGNSIVKVFDLMGKQVGLYHVNAHSELQLNQPSGIYFIHVDSNGKTSTHKVIVQ